MISRARSPGSRRKLSPWVISIGISSIWPRVTQDLDHLIRVAQGHLAVGQLHVSPGPEMLAQHVELGGHRRDGQCGRGVGGVVQVAAPAGKITAWHDADGRPAAFFVTAKHLVGGAEFRVDFGPGHVQRSLRIGGNRRAEKSPQIVQSQLWRMRGSRSENAPSCFCSAR